MTMRTPTPAHRPTHPTTSASKSISFQNAHAVQKGIHYYLLLTLDSVPTFSPRICVSVSVIDIRSSEKDGTEIF